MRQGVLTLWLLLVAYHDHNAAVDYYMLALKYSEGHLKAALALARVCLARGDSDQCHQMC